MSGFSRSLKAARHLRIIGRVASAAFLCLSACSSGHFQESGPLTRELRSGETPIAGLRPRLTIKPAGSIGTLEKRVQVVSHQIVRRGGKVLVKGDGENIEIDYRIGNALRFPLKAGDWVYLSSPAKGDGLRVRDDARTLLALLAIEDGFEELFEFQVMSRIEGILPSYTEVRAEPNGCLTTLEHYPLSLVHDEALFQVMPGMSRKLFLKEEDKLSFREQAEQGTRPYVLHAISASQPSLRRQALEGRCVSRAHTSLFLLRDTP